MIKVRFAPSPTGSLHIGTARTALFNYLFAKNQKGKLILRFEDTDLSRSTQAYVKEIIDSLKWLGISFDEGPFYQSKRLSIYHQYLRKLEKIGQAYQKEGAFYFKVGNPKDDFIEWNDLIHGKIRYPILEIEDFVILKKNGTPTFNFAVIIDDLEMKISHVIRGEDHIPNTPKQLLIARILGKKEPLFAHIPLILAPDRSKLSKRHGATAVLDYQKQGYLPEAFLNFLVLLGWRPKEGEEIFSLGNMIKKFKLGDVGKSPSIFDIEKLNYLNGYYIRDLSPNRLGERLREFGYKGKIDQKVLGSVKERMKKLDEFPKLIHFYYKKPKIKAKLLVFKKSSISKTTKGLEAVFSILDKSPNFLWKNPARINAILSHTVKENKLNNGDVFWPARYALSGEVGSPPPADILSILGKKESLSRLKKAIDLLKKR